MLSDGTPSAKSKKHIKYRQNLINFWSKRHIICKYRRFVDNRSIAADESDKFGRRLVAIEFDDGDCGNIRLEDIRLLPPDFPITSKPSSILTFSSLFTFQVSHRPLFVCFRDENARFARVHHSQAIRRYDARPIIIDDRSTVACTRATTSANAETPPYNGTNLR